jgi:hypothetical protein
LPKPLPNVVVAVLKPPLPNLPVVPPKPLVGAAVVVVVGVTPKDRAPAVGAALGAPKPFAAPKPLLKLPPAVLVMLVLVLVVVPKPPEPPGALPKPLAGAVAAPNILASCRCESCDAVMEREREEGVASEVRFGARPALFCRVRLGDGACVCVCVDRIQEHRQQQQTTARKNEGGKIKGDACRRVAIGGDIAEGRRIAAAGYRRTWGSTYRRYETVRCEVAS